MKINSLKTFFTILFASVIAFMTVIVIVLIVLQNKNMLGYDFVNNMIKHVIQRNMANVDITDFNVTIEDNSQTLVFSAKALTSTKTNAKFKIRNAKIEIPIQKIFYANFMPSVVNVKSVDIEYVDKKAPAESVKKDNTIQKIPFNLGIFSNQVLKTLEAIFFVKNITIESMNVKYYKQQTGLRVIARDASVTSKLQKNSHTLMLNANIKGYKNNKALFTHKDAILKVSLKPNTDNKTQFQVRLTGLEDITTLQALGTYTPKHKTVTAEIKIALPLISRLQFYDIPLSAYTNAQSIRTTITLENYALSKGGRINVKSSLDDMELFAKVDITAKKLVVFSAGVENISPVKLNTYWPKGKFLDTKKWMNDNINGTYDANINLRYNIRDNIYSDIFGDITVKDAQISYYKSMPKITVPKATASYTSKAIYIKSDTAYLNVKGQKLSPKMTSVDIISGKNSVDLNIKVDAETSLENVKNILSNPSINIALPHKDLYAGTGISNGKLFLSFDLKKGGKFKDFQYKGFVEKAYLPKFMQWNQVSSDMLNINLNTKGAKGSGVVKFDNDSTGAAKFIIQGDKIDVEYNGVAGVKSVAYYNVGYLIDFKKPLPVAVRVKQKPKGLPIITVKSTLNNSPFSIPIIGWTKQKPSKTGLNLIIKVTEKDLRINGEFTSADKINPLSAVAKTVLKNNTLHSLNIEKFKIGKGSGNVAITLNDTVLKVKGTGSKIPVQRVLTALQTVQKIQPAKQQQQSQPEKTKQQESEHIPMRYDIDVDLKDSQSFENVKAKRILVKTTLNKDNMYTDALVNIDFTDKKKRTYLKFTKGDGLRVYVGDMGKLYMFVSGRKPISKGVLDISGKADDTGIIRGLIRGKDVHVVDVNQGTRLLKILSISGIWSAIKNKALVFNAIHGDFTLDTAGVMNTKNISLISQSTGISIRGKVDFLEKYIDLYGMIVPSYTINKSLGKIPILGTVITGVDNQGFLSQDYTAKGTFEDYELKLSPRGLLTMGILHDIFGTIFQWDTVPIITEPDGVE